VPHATAALAATVLVTALAAPSAAADRCAGSDTMPTDDTLSDTATAVVCQINQERRRRNVPALHGDDRLDLAGGRHAHDMVTRDYFSHVTPGGRGFVARLRAVGYLDDASRWAVGETLAWGRGRRATPSATVAAWMTSPPHRRVLLNRRYRDIGIGVTLGIPFGRAAGATYAAEFGVVG
jgi:uncharacterized protein YkwD